MAGRETPLTLRWDRGRFPLPVREVRLPRGQSQGRGIFGQPWHETGLHGQPFDFTGHVARLVQDISVRCPAWRHIQVSRMLIGHTQAQSPRPYGLQARVTPLRFAGGTLRRRHRGRMYQIQRLFFDDVEYLYLLTFCLPRFLDQDFDHKLVTLFHELYHIGPEFDGDLRRHEGRYHLHSHSRGEYDERVTHFAREYLATRPDPKLTGFLRLDFEQLRQRHGKVLGIVVPRPKLVPVTTLLSETAARHAE